jgi:hypothetical protein
MKVVKSILSMMLIFICSSCIKFDVNLVVNSDGTVNGRIIYAVSESLTSLSESSDSNTELDGLLDESTPGVTVKPYDQGGYEGKQYFLENVPFDEFEDNGNSGELSFKREGDQITMSGYLDLEVENDESTTDDEIFGDALAQSLLSSGDIRIRVTFPAEVIATTGELSKDKRTVTWNPKIGDRIDLTTTVRLPASNFLIYVLIVLGFAIIAIVALSRIKSKRNKLTSDSLIDS